MPSNKLRNNELEFTPTLVTQQAVTTSKEDVMFRLNVESVLIYGKKTGLGLIAVFALLSLMTSLSGVTLKRYQNGTYDSILFSTIQDAISHSILNQADFDEYVLEVDGTFYENLVIDGLDTTMTIEGQNAVIDGNSFDSVIKILNSTQVSLKNLSVTNGKASGSVQTARIRHMLVDGNWTYIGAYPVHDSPGGGVLLCDVNSVNIENCNIHNNQAAYGGGIYSYKCTNLNISNSIIRHNTNVDDVTTNYGTAIGSYASNLNINNSQINYNYFTNETNYAVIFVDAYQENHPYSFSMLDTEVSFNTSKFYSMYILNTPNRHVNIENCTITKNTTSFYSPIYVRGYESNTTHRVLANLTNCIVWDNTFEGTTLAPPQISGQYVTFTMNNCILEDLSDIGNQFLYYGSVSCYNCIDLDPQFTDVSVNDLTLSWDETRRSPAILSAYVDGLTADSHENPDIGAHQFDLYPHEYRTYRFPSGNERNGIKWMSFPSLDRVFANADMAHTFFDPLRHPLYLENISWKVLNGPINNLSLNYDEWVGTNHDIQPQIGYKFQMNQNLQNQITISTPAIKPDPNLSILLKAKTDQRSSIPDNENWLGYFVERTAHPFEAFEDILDNLWFIQSQDWTISRMSISPSSPWIYVAYQGSKSPTLRYGDMVIVKCFEDAEFSWNSDAEEREPFEKMQTQHFLYTEKIDYLPVFVEFEDPDLPKEAAIYVAGLCKGAAVVEGSIVEIPTYIMDEIFEGMELELRVFYDNKSSYNPIPQYQRWNDDTASFEPAFVIVGEREHLYYLKVGKDSLESIPTPRLYLGAYPNPFNPETTLRFYIPDEASVRLDIYNIKGQKVRDLINESCQAGTYTAIWNGRDSAGKQASSGMYFAVLTAGGNQLSRKLMLLK